MDYKDTKIGFAAQLDPNAKKPDTKISIGFCAALSKHGNGDPTHESSIGFTAKLPERKPEKPHPQMDLDF
jgi:hypothetical protein